MSTSTHKAAIVEQYTSSSTDYKVAELPRPSISTPTQVEVKVHAASINPIDYKRAAGSLAIAIPEPFPLRLGYDVSGVITQTGASASKFKVGDAVYGRIHSENAGTLAEYVVAEESALARKPDSISFVSAAAVPLAGLTALQALEKGGLKEGMRFFVGAGLGGVGQFAVALARHHFKAGEVATTVSEKKAAKAAELGATKVVDYRKEDATAVLANFADVVFDTVGDSSLAKVVKPGGKFISIAMLPDGDALEGFTQSTHPLSMFGRVKLGIAKSIVNGIGWFVTREFRAKGVECQYLLMHPSGDQLLNVFNPLLESGTIAPVISNVYAFDDQGVQGAFRELMDGHATGKVVVEVCK